MVVSYRLAVTLTLLHYLPVMCVGTAYQQSKLPGCCMETAYIAVVDIPSPTDGHGWTLGSGYLEPLWVDGPILPKLLQMKWKDLDSGDSDDGSGDDESIVAVDSDEDDDYDD